MKVLQISVAHLCVLTLSKHERNVSKKVFVGVQQRDPGNGNNRVTVGVVFAIFIVVVTTMDIDLLHSREDEEN